MPSRPLESALRLAAGIALATLLAQAFAADLAAMLLPLIRWEIGWLDDRFRILQLAVAHAGADTVLRIDVTPARPIPVAARIVPVDPRSHIEAATLIGPLLQPAILVLATALAWPATAWRRYPVRLLWAMPLLALLLMVDMPVLLVAELGRSLLDAAGSDAVPPLAVWADFLQGGGRPALAIAASVALVAPDWPARGPAKSGCHIGPL